MATDCPGEEKCAGLARVQAQIEPLLRIPELLTSILTKMGSIEEKVSGSAEVDSRLRTAEEDIAGRKQTVKDTAEAQKSDAERHNQRFQWALGIALVALLGIAVKWIEGR